MVLLIDNYDSFTYNVYQLMGSVDPDIRVIRNDEMTIKEIEMLSPDHIVVSLPLLRKDFTVDEYMLYQAKLAGADAVLLICAILSPSQLEEYLGIARELGLSALVETHDGQEIEMALRAGARVVGVNNRNLKDFTVDMHNSVQLRELVPGEILFVSESGIKTREQVRRLEENGTDAVLIGETLMRSQDKAGMLRWLRGREDAGEISYRGERQRGGIR